MASRLARGPAARLSRASTARAAAPSSTALGTAYELACLSWLTDRPLGLTHTVKMGGAGDKGVDLRGRWSGRPLLPDGEGRQGATGAARFTAIVQCKAYAEKVQPAVVRELEGTLAAQAQRRPSFSTSSFSSPSLPPSRTALTPVAFLLTLSGFSAEAIKHANASRLPLSLLHLRPREQGKLQEAAKAGQRGRLSPADMELVSASYNVALRRLVEAEGQRVEELEREAVEKAALAAG
ncbi:hypothetical protein JCM10213_000671 [Rhodosporidiobolus nylandii]